MHFYACRLFHFLHRGGTCTFIPTLVTESMALKQIEREEKYGDTLTKKHEEDSKDKK